MEQVEKIGGSLGGLSIAVSDDEGRIVTKAAPVEPDGGDLHSRFPLLFIDPALVKCGVFVASGLLTGFGALINASRFNQIPSNAGLGLELKVVAAVVVGGAAITGGKGSIAGTLLGVILLGAIGPALTFLGVSAYWERAIQGAIILAAVAIDAVRACSQRSSAGAAGRYAGNVAASGA